MSHLRRSRHPRSGELAPTALARVLDEQGRRLIWVAEHLGVDSSTVSRWRSGDRPIPARRRDQLAAVLGVAAADLVDAPGRAAGASEVPA